MFLMQPLVYRSYLHYFRYVERVQNSSTIDIVGGWIGISYSSSTFISVHQATPSYNG